MNKKRMESAKGKRISREKLFSAMTSILLVVAILFCGFVMLQIKLKGYVSIFGCSVFHVVSGSMEPEIPVGTLIISKTTDIKDIRERDIITFRSLEPYMKDQMVTHRVVGIEIVNGELALHTKGDANNSEDGYYVTEDNLVGRVIYQTPGENIFKKLYELLTTKVGFFGIVVVPVMLLAAFILRENVKRINREIANIKREVARLKEAEAKNDVDVASSVNSEEKTSPSPDDEINQENSDMP